MSPKQSHARVCMGAVCIHMCARLSVHVLCVCVCTHVRLHMCVHVSVLCTGMHVLMCGSTCAVPMPAHVCVSAQAVGMHLCVYSRLLATVAPPSSCFHAKKETKEGFMGSQHLPSILWLRISPSYQPSKWKEGGRTLRRQDSCCHARTCMHKQPKAGGSKKLPSVVLAAGCFVEALVALRLVAAVSGLGKGDL